MGRKEATLYRTGSGSCEAEWSWIDCDAVASCLPPYIPPMNGDRRWYREPETFIAVTAFVENVSAVVVGLYEAHLQRAHDRAEVWPHARAR
jgi:hypothetical protein